MLSLSTARRLRAAGLTWTPACTISLPSPNAGMDDRVFVISDVSVDIELLQAGPSSPLTGPLSGRWTIP